MPRLFRHVGNFERWGVLLKILFERCTTSKSLYSISEQPNSSSFNLFPLPGFAMFKYPASSAMPGRTAGKTLAWQIWQVLPATLLPSFLCPSDFPKSAGKAGKTAKG